jgi:hypothetical protein
VAYRRAVPNLKYPELFHLNGSQAFDFEHPAGAPAPFPGIYRCHCGHEIASPDGLALPSGAHPLHPQGQVVAWRLVAAARRNEAGVPATGAGDFAAPPGWPTV